MRRLFSSLLLTLLATPVAFVSAKGRPVSYSDVIRSTVPVKLAFPGKTGPVDYSLFGSFEGLGTPAYKYVITNKTGLASAVGEGIFPNKDVTRDPAYQALKKSSQLEGNQWNFIDTRRLDLNFYKWASTSEEPGVKQFYTAVIFERLGMIEEAIKAFYAAAVHFPKSLSYTYYKTPWYIGPGSLDRIEALLRRHPDIKMELIGGAIDIKNRFDNDPKNDVFSIDPGKLMNVKRRKDSKPLNMSKIAVVKTIGGPAVQLKKYENGHWQLFVDGKPFQIKGITYSVTPVGLSPDRGTWVVYKDWQLLDTNKNGIHDGLFEAYVDKNGNGVRDTDEPVVGDAKLLKDLGVNTLRTYHHVFDKELFRRLHKEDGFYILCGDLLGGYTVGSGALWTNGTDYTDPKQQQTMLDSVRAMVEDLKGEPYILMWVLGNENIYGVGNNSPGHPEAFYEMVNRAAKLIHQLDPSRPVALANGDLLDLNIIQEKCPDVDVMGANAYRGEQGFGRHFFSAVRSMLDKPVLITEYGCSAYAEGYTPEEAENYQAMYLANNWEDLEANMAGRGVGNALGGVLFEFIDEWWKANTDLPLSVQVEKGGWYTKRSATYKNLQPENHDTVPQFGFPFLDGWSYEEWYGLVSQGSGKDNPFARILRPAYFEMQKMWKE